MLFLCLLLSLLAASGDAAQWPARVCCELAIAPACKSACSQVKTPEAIRSSCQPNAELAFFACLHRQDVSSQCCDPSPSSQCRAVCKALFISESRPGSDELKLVSDYCSTQVYSCVHNYSMSRPRPRPTDTLPCCQASHNKKCQARCRHILTTMTKEQMIVDELIKSCGQIFPTNPLWQCFLRHSQNRRQPQGQGKETRGIDGAKLFCCHKAGTRECKEMCVRTHSKGWTNSWKEFQMHCNFGPAETELTQCLAEVEEPCQLGCDKLNFCTNFNSRPTELFRSCNVRADNAAEKDFKSWEGGEIALPVLPVIPVKDIKQCHPEKWKAIACALQLKPCQEHCPIRICRSDCLNILNDCVDKSRLKKEQTVEYLCKLLSPDDPRVECLNIGRYMVPSGAVGREHGVTNPCKDNPCKGSQVCMVNRRKCKHPEKCPAYVCKAGCPLGELSSYYVPRNSIVRVPKKKSRQECYNMCHCGHGNELTHCKDMGCVKNEICVVGSSQIKAHDNNFNIDCNDCACYSGELICRRSPCTMSHAQGAVEIRKTYTGLPCDCPNQYSPVCGVNGRTYPSGCIARCSGLRPEEHYIEGSCVSKDPCSGNLCQPGLICVPRRRVCLTSLGVPCPQYDCVEPASTCQQKPHDPVCDTDNVEHRNLCIMRQLDKMLAHFGHCKEHCSSVGTVCGINGETYPSECAAWADRVSVDYHGNCRTVGRMYAGRRDSVCSKTKCPKLPTTKCEPITPPGACCPLCAGEIRSLFSRKLSDQATKLGKRGPVTVQSMIELLSHQILVPQCQLVGYLSIDSDLVFLVLPIYKNPTPWQLEACIVEARKLGSLIESRSPTVMSHLMLSSLRTAKTRVAHLQVPSGASRTSRVNTSVVLALFLTLVFSWRSR